MTADRLEGAIRNVVLTAVAMIGLVFVVVILTNALPEQPVARTIDAWWETQRAILNAAGFVLAVGIGIIALDWSRNGRDESYVDRALISEYEPPAGVAPAELGALVDGVAGTRHVTATLIDLAIRGHIAIREDKGRGWVLARLEGGDALARQFERTFVSTLFEKGNEIELGSVNDTFYWATVYTELDLNDALVRRGWLRSEPAALRRARRLRGLAVAAAGLFLTAGLGIRLGAGYVGLAVVVSGLAFTVAAGAMHARTALGHRLLRESLGFKLYLEVAEADEHRFAERADLFTTYLPYAVALGIANEWALRFDLAGTVYSRAWYKPATSGGLRHVEFAERLSRITARG